MKRKLLRNQLTSLKGTDQIVLLLTVISLFFVSCISIYSLNRNIQSREKIVQNSLSSLALNGRQQFKDYIQNKIDILTYIADFPQIYEMDPEQQKAFLYNRSHLIGFHHMFIMDTEGNGYYIDENVHRQQKAEPFFTDIMTHDIFITEPFYNQDTRTTIITLCVSLYNEQNEKQGVLCGAIDMSEFQKVFFENQKDSKCFVVDADGTYMVSDNMQDVYNRVSIYEHSQNRLTLIEKALDTHQDQFGLLSMNGTEYYTHITYIKELNWILGYQLPVSLASEDLHLIHTMQLISIIETIVLIFCVYHILYLWKKSNKKLYTDSLTGCNSRVAFFNMLQRLEKQKHLEVAIVYMDLNRFKLVNDTYGHDMGDLILCKFSEALVDVFGKEGMVARLGGDEFAAILLNETAESIEEMWQQVQQRLQEKSKELPFDYQIASSYGITFRHKDSSQSLNDVLRKADENMYLCKEKMHAQQ